MIWEPWCTSYDESLISLNITCHKDNITESNHDLTGQNQELHSSFQNGSVSYRSAYFQPAVTFTHFMISGSIRQELLSH